jgi:hypothetical protein
MHDCILWLSDWIEALVRLGLWHVLVVVYWWLSGQFLCIFIHDLMCAHVTVASTEKPCPDWIGSAFMTEYFGGFYYAYSSLKALSFIALLFPSLSRFKPWPLPCERLRACDVLGVQRMYICWTGMGGLIATFLIGFGRQKTLGSYRHTPQKMPFRPIRDPSPLPKTFRIVRLSLSWHVS